MVKKKGLVQQVADDIYKMITSDGIFKPGEQLPSENILSSQLGISRATLREAIRILASQGILEVYRGKGTFISKDIKALGAFGLESMERIRVHLKDLYETRLIFEPEIAALACRRATDEELKNIFKIGHEVEEFILKGMDRTEIDQKFHEAIVEASHNEFLKQLLPLINKCVQDSITLNSGCSLPSDDILAKNTLRDHAQIMEFLKVRDAVGTKYAMSIHFRHAIEILDINTGEEPIY